MKNTNAQTDKNNQRKFAIIVTTLVTALFAATSNSSIVQAAELVKAEPIQQINLITEAKESLAISFMTLTISKNFNNEATKSMMAKQKNSANKNKPMTLTKINVVAE